MGRRKIDIVRIENERHRQVTFTKRKGGLIKKATELSVLCDAEVAVIIFAQNNKMSVYSSGAADEIVKKYLDHKDLPEVRDSTARGIPCVLAASRAHRANARHPSRVQVHTTEDYFREKIRKAGGTVEESRGAGDDSDDDGDDAGMGAASSAAAAAPNQSGVHAAMACNAGASAMRPGPGAYCAPGASTPAYMCMAPGAYMNGMHSNNTAVVPPHHPQMQYPPWQMPPPGMAPQPGMMPQPGMPPQHMGMPPPQHMGMPPPQHMGMVSPQHMPHLVNAHAAGMGPPGQRHPVPGGVHAIVPAPQQRVPGQQPPPQTAPLPSPGTSFAPPGGPPLAKAAARKPRNHKNLVIEAPARAELGEAPGPAATTPMAREPSPMPQSMPQANPGGQPLDAFARATGVSPTGVSPAVSPAGWFMQPPMPGSATNAAPPNGSSQPGASAPAAEAGPSQPRAAAAPAAPPMPTQSCVAQHGASP